MGNESLKNITREVVADVARDLINRLGSTTSLDVKNELRNMGYYAVQSDVSSLLDETANTQGWHHKVDGDHRIYSFATLSNQTDKKNPPVKPATSVLRFLSPEGLIQAASKAHPGFRYAVVVGGIMGIVAVVSRYGISPATLVFGSIIIVVLMVLFLVFSQIAVAAKEHFSVPGTVLIWSYLVISILTALFLFLSAFFNGPLPLRDYIIRQLGPLATPTPSATPGQASTATPAPISNENFPPTDPKSGFVETDSLRASSGSGDGDDVKVDKFTLLPPGTSLDTSYQQTAINAISGRNAETPLVAANIPPGFYIECKGDTDNGKRWAVRPPYSGPILSEQPAPNRPGLTQYKFTLGIYADTGHHDPLKGSTGGCDVVVRVFYKPLKR